MSVQLKELLRMAHEQLDSQAAMIDRLASNITELEKERDDAVTAYNNCMTGNQIHIRDLEQQAKGISDFVYSIEGFSEGYIQALKEDTQ
jgi:hypothetical protein